MANDLKMSFNDLPDEVEGDVKVGINELRILTASKELSKKGKLMLVLTVCPVKAENLKIYQRFALWNDQYQPESFGQSELKKLLKAVDYIPKKDFSIETLVPALPDLTFKAELEKQEGLDGKEYLGIKPKTYVPANQAGISDKKEEEVTPDDFEEPVEEKPSTKIKAELEDDDDVV